MHQRRIQRIMQEIISEGFSEFKLHMLLGLDVTLLGTLNGCSHEDLKTYDYPRKYAYHAVYSSDTLGEDHLSVIRGLVK